MYQCICGRCKICSGMIFGEVAGAGGSSSGIEKNRLRLVADVEDGY